MVWQGVLSQLVFASLLAFIISCGTVCSAAITQVETQQTCYVTPNPIKQPCPDSPCYTLSDYVRNESLWQCFGSGATMQFLSGVHRLLEPIVIASVTNLAFIGESNATSRGRGLPPEPSSQVICSVPQSNARFSFTANHTLHEGSTGGFVITNSSNLAFKYLTFVGCGGFYNKVCGPHSALSFENVVNLIVVNISVHDSNGYGLCGSNVLGTSLISDSRFEYNNGHTTYHSYYNGGNMRLYFRNCPSYHSHFKISTSDFFHGTSDYNESYAAGLAMTIINCSSVHIEIESSNFTNNKANNGGNMAISFTNMSHNIIHPVSIRNCHLEGGTAYRGGGLHVSVVDFIARGDLHSNNTVILYVFNSTLFNNYAWGIAGGLYITHSESASPLFRPMEIVIESCFFGYNIKGYHSYPGGIATHVSTFSSVGYQLHILPRLAYKFELCTFEGSHDAANDNFSASVFAVQESSVTFKNCIFRYNECSSLAGIASSLLFRGNITFKNNYADNGAGLLLCERSVVYLFPNTTVWFYDNHAVKKGGALHAEDECMQSVPPCFYQLSSSIAAHPQRLLSTVQIIMFNNTAGSAGTAIYGGSVKYCYFIERIPNQYTKELVVFNSIFNITSKPFDISLVASDPIGVCLCNALRKCNEEIHKFYVDNTFPGKSFNVSVVIVGQMNGSVPGVVMTGLLHNPNNSFLHQANYLQSVPKAVCTSLKFTVFSDRPNETLVLQPQRPAYTKQHYEPPWVIVKFLDCPIGFAHSNLTHKCDCISSLKDYKITCDITNQTIRRVSPLWIGSATTHNTSHVLVCTNCPLDYCKSSHVDLLVTNTTILQNTQCAFKRVGILCGQCKGNHSLMLGSSQCAHCSSMYLLLLVSFAVAGVLLVFMLFLCNITVSEGTLSGLIFYANIVQLNNSAFFPPSPKHVALQILAGVPKAFIAWLNLDLGIEVCFFHGMDMYSRTWLQFAFPFYIWGIAGFLVLLSRRYNFIARLLGKNAVKVLATLFLISYTKLQRAVVTVITFSVITIHPGASNRLVWLFDGNVQYLRGKHIPLFFFAIIIGLVSLPYTIVLFFITCLQRMSGYRVLHYVNKLKPLFDAYTGPYTDKCRFWPGLLLVARVVLLVVYAFNITGNPRINLIMSACVCMVLLMLSWFYRGGIYKLWSLDVLEAFFIANLGILSATTAYFQTYQWERETYGYTSIGLSMLGFTGIVFYHTQKAIRASQHFNLPSITLFYSSLNAREEFEPITTIAPSDADSATRELEDVDSAELLESPQPIVHRRLDRCREPLLETASYRVN